MLSKAQDALLKDKLALWRSYAETGPVDFRDYNKRAAEALNDLWGDAEELREILHDLVMCRAEQEAVGGGPGWQERDAKAWRRAEEIFEP